LGLDDLAESGLGAIDWATHQPNLRVGGPEKGYGCVCLWKREIAKNISHNDSEKFEQYQWLIFFAVSLFQGAQRAPAAFGG